MSLDPSLKIKGALTRHRNVLTRAERIETLKDEERWTEENSVFGLPKVAHRKSHAGRKGEEDEAKEAAAPEAAVATEAPKAEKSPKSEKASKPEKK
jgi:small basic protein (TIGR04137 family)